MEEAEMVAQFLACVCVHGDVMNDKGKLLFCWVAYHVSYLDLANKCRVNLKPHPRVFWFRSKYLPQSRDSVNHRKSS